MKRGSVLLLALGAVAIGAAMSVGRKEEEPDEDQGPTPQPPKPPGPKPDGKYTPPSAKQWADFRQALIAAGVTNFTAEELASAGGGKFVIPKGFRLVNFLKIIRHAQAIRTLYGRPLLISSGYRPWDKKDSNHELGTAIDFDLPGGSKTKANERALRLAVAKYWKATPELQGMGFYRAPTGRVHIDVNTKKGRRFWHKEEVQPILDALKQA